VAGAPDRCRESQICHPKAVTDPVVYADGVFFGRRGVPERVGGVSVQAASPTPRSVSMSTAGLPTIWELVAEGAATLPEPFSRAALINWVSARRPDVGVSSIAAHIQFATDNAGHAGHNPFAERTPLLHRVDRGLYRRCRPPAPEWLGMSGVPAGTPSGVVARVLLLASSGATAAAAMPAAGLFPSPGFSRAREHAVRSGLPWFVLSAKHGLLDPEDVVGPYDVQIGDRSSGYRTAWGEWVVAHLADRVPLEGAVVEVHGGVDFAQPLRHPLAVRGAGLEIPLPEMWRDAEPGRPGHGDAFRLGGPGKTGAPMRAAIGRLRGLVTRHRSDDAGPGGGSTGRLDASAS
jgi:hypothetical protein